MPLLIFNHGDYFFLVYIVCTYGDVAWRLFLVIDSFNWAYTLYLSHLLYKERAGHHNKSLMHKKLKLVTLITGKRFAFPSWILIHNTVIAYHIGILDQNPMLGTRNFSLCTAESTSKSLLI